MMTIYLPEKYTVRFEVNCTLYMLYEIIAHEITLHGVLCAIFSS